MRGSNPEADLIHQLVTKALIAELQKEEPSLAAIDKAIKFLKDNGITRFGGKTLGEGDKSPLEEELDRVLGRAPDLPDFDEPDEPLAL